MSATEHVIDPRVPQEFLAQRRIAVVGASDAKDSFGGTIYQELRDHGHDPVAVNPSADTVRGDPCYPDLASVPGDLDGVIVMVHRDRAADVVRDCVAKGVPRVWLFKGVGGAGAVSEEAVELCREHGIAVVPGACPLMFLEPVAWFHRVHRRMRRMNRSLARAS
jgi:uncharacterized protein